MKYKVKNFYVSCLVCLLAVVLVGCGGKGSLNDAANFSPKDAFKIEDIDWEVTQSIHDGERIASLNYTNNSDFTIMEMTIKYKLKLNDENDKTISEITKQLINDYELEEDELFYLEVKGTNSKFADPGETVKDAPCYINGFYDIKNMKVLEILEPDMMTITFIGPDDKGYQVYYDFTSSEFSESSMGGINIHEKTENKLFKALPEKEFRALRISSEDDDYLNLLAFGVEKKDFDEYVSLLKEAGFTKENYSYDGVYDASNSNNQSVRISYDQSDEQMYISIEIEEDEE